MDLMRYSPEAPNGIMDAMLLHLFEWAKQEGYQYFNIGMAPLSNVGISPHSFWSERVAAAIFFNNVRYMYSFSGLRYFKEKNISRYGAANIWRIEKNSFTAGHDACCDAINRKTRKALDTTSFSYKNDFFYERARVAAVRGNG
ncbi:hypothetical protein GCM10020331_092520 [Ectobacillus funiculus]